MAEKAAAPNEEEKKYKARADLETLKEAERIMRDPERLDAVRAEAGKQSKDLENIKGKMARLKGATNGETG
jgi:hypothetical protein